LEVLEPELASASAGQREVKLEQLMRRKQMLVMLAQMQHW
jgi:hypothetical protein